MIIIKSYIDLSQSRKSAEILPIESADMYWFRDSVEVPRVYPKDMMKNSVSVTCPCWSLAALFNYLKSKNKFPEIEELSDGRFKLTTYIWDGENSIQVSIEDTIVDACYEMILKLHELDLL